MLNPEPFSYTLHLFCGAVEAERKKQSCTNCGEHLRRHRTDKQTQPVFRNGGQVVEVNRRGRFQSALWAKDYF